MINLSWTLQKLVDFTVNQKSNSSYFLIFDNIDSAEIKSESEATIKRRSADLTSMTNNATSSNATALITLAKSSAAFKTFIVILVLLIIAAMAFLVKNNNFLILQSISVIVCLIAGFLLLQTNSRPEAPPATEHCLWLRPSGRPGLGGSQRELFQYSSHYNDATRCANDKCLSLITVLTNLKSFFFSFNFILFSVVCFIQ